MFGITFGLPRFPPFIAFRLPSFFLLPSPLSLSLDSFNQGILAGIYREQLNLRGENYHNLPTTGGSGATGVGATTAVARTNGTTWRTFPTWTMLVWFVELVRCVAISIILPTLKKNCQQCNHKTVEKASSCEPAPRRRVRTDNVKHYKADSSRRHVAQKAAAYSAIWHPTPIQCVGPATTDDQFH